MTLKYKIIPIDDRTVEHKECFLISVTIPGLEYPKIVHQEVGNGSRKPFYEKGLAKKAADKFIGDYMKKPEPSPEREKAPVQMSLF